MHCVFMGTPDFATPSLKALAASHTVDLVVTRPDAVRGRGKKLVASPVKECASELGIPVLEAARITPEVLSQVAHAAGGAAPDVIVVAAYGCLLPQELLDIPRLECVNVHASLLPQWRGAAPIQRGILAGDAELGVSIMRVVLELDAGPYCAQASLPRGEQTADELMSELAELGAQTLCSALARIEAGEATWTEQDESLVTYAKKISKQEMLLNPQDTALANRLRVQAAFDAAPARFALCGKGVRVLDARVACSDAFSAGSGAGHSAGPSAGPSAEATDLPAALIGLGAGQVLVEHGRVWLGCAEGALELLQVKPDGKRDMPASAWAQGLKASAGGELTWEQL